MECKAKLASNCMLLNVFMTFNQSMPAKFNCTVPGTLYDFSTDCLPVPTFNESPTTQALHSQSTTMTATSTRNSTTLTTQAITTNLTMPNEKQPPKFEVGNQLFYAVVGSGGGIVTVLICCLCCVCVLLVCRRNRIKGNQININKSMLITIMYIDTLCTCMFLASKYQPLQAQKWKEGYQQQVDKQRQKIMTKVYHNYTSLH